MGNWFVWMTAALAPLLMIASGSVHAVVNAIVKGGRDKMAARAMTDGSAAVILLPALLVVPLPGGAWGWLVATAAVHALYLYSLIRAYQVRVGGEPGPWLAGMTLEPSAVCEAWCHERGYVSFIQELHRRRVKAGESFGAAYVVGWFGDVAEMERTYDEYKDAVGIEIEGDRFRLGGNNSVGSLSAGNYCQRSSGAEKKALDVHR